MSNTKIDAQLQNLIAEACDVLKAQSAAARQLGTQIDKGTSELIEQLEQIEVLYCDRQDQVIQRLSQLTHLVRGMGLEAQNRPTDMRTRTDQRKVIEWLDQVSKRQDHAPVSTDTINSMMAGAIQPPRRYAATE